MQLTALNPLELQRAIIDLVLQRQVDSGPVSDTDLASALDVDIVTLRVHLEMLAAEGRLEIVRDEDEHRAFATEEQRARHEAPPPHVAARQTLEQIGDTLETIQDRMNRIFAWAPLVLMLAGGALGWFCTGPDMRVETTFFVGLFGLMVGFMIRKELIR